MEAQATGEVHSRAQALRWAEQWLKEHADRTEEAEAEEEEDEAKAVEEIAEIAGENGNGATQ